MTSSRFTAIGLAGAAVIGLAKVRFPSLVAHSVFVAFCLAATVVLARSITDEDEGSHRVTNWAVVAFVVHLGLGYVINNLSTLSGYLGGDASQYHFGAQQLIAHWETGAPAPTYVLGPGKGGFTILLAALYLVFGPYPIVGLAANAFFAAALVPLMVDTTSRLFGAAAAHWVPPLVLLPVGFLLWPSQLLREAGILFFMAVALNAGSRLWLRTRPMSVAVVATSIAVLFTFRHYAALAMAGGLVFGLFLGRRGLGRLHATGGAILLLAGLVFGIGLGLGGVQTLQATGLAEANQIRRGSATEAASGFLEDADVSTTENALTYLPRSMPRLLLGPFPWEVRGARQVPALIDVAVIWVLLPRLLRGWRAARRGHRRSLPLLTMPALFLTVVLSLLVANYGTVVRARLQILLLVVPLIALGVASRRGLVEANDGISGAAPARALGARTGT